MKQLTILNLRMIISTINMNSSLFIVINQIEQNNLECNMRGEKVECENNKNKHFVPFTIKVRKRKTRERTSLLLRFFPHF